MTTLETNALPFAIITFINKDQAIHQRQLDEWLATQPTSTPTLRISNHQSLTLHHIKRWSLDHVITRPMSLEQQLQSILNHLQSHHEYRILIIEPCETLPLSTLTALKHLAQQQHELPQPLLQIVLCGTQDPYNQELNNSLLPPASQTQLNTPNTTTHNTNQSQRTYQQSSQAIMARANQHPVKMISLVLLGILMYILWQMQHHPKHSHNTPPLTPNTQLIHPIHSQQTNQATQPPKTPTAKAPIKKQPITTKTHYTLQWASSHDSAATKALQQKLHITNSRILEVIQDKQVRFILISGNYKTIHEAKLALQALPASTHTQKPWIRPITAS